MDVSLDEIIKRNKINNVKNRRRKMVGGQNDRKEVGSIVTKGAIAKRIGSAPQRNAGVPQRGVGAPQRGVGAPQRGVGAPQRGVGTPQRNAGAPQRGAAALKNAGVKKKKVSDLRMLIGGKAGARTPGPVRDAREKLGKVARVSDAREKLISRTTAIGAEMLMRRGRRSSVGPRRKLDPRKPAYMDLEEARLKNRSGGSSLLYRTVDNNTNYLRGDYRPMVSSVNRPLHPLASVNRPAPTPLIPDAWLQPSVQDITRFQPLTRTFNQEDVWAQPQIPRRSSSNGLNAKRRLEREEEISHTQGYRIVVSNLQPSVTHEDIKELFEDIGSLYSSRVVRPGTAEVIYKNMEDAVKAVDTYHNRQLDGQPMKCLLVKPSNMSRILSKGSVIPDLHAIHKALFNK